MNWETPTSWSAFCFVPLHQSVAGRPSTCSVSAALSLAVCQAPLAALGDTARAAGLQQRTVEERCSMLAMVLRHPAHAGRLPQAAAGRALLKQVFGVRR